MKICYLKNFKKECLKESTQTSINIYSSKYFLFTIFTGKCCICMPGSCQGRKKHKCFIGEKATLHLSSINYISARKFLLIGAWVVPSVGFFLFSPPYLMSILLNSWFKYSNVETTRNNSDWFIDNRMSKDYIILEWHFCCDMYKLTRNIIKYI